MFVGSFWEMMPGWAGGIYQVDLAQGCLCHLESRKANQPAETGPLAILREDDMFKDKLAANVFF